MELANNHKQIICGGKNEEGVPFSFGVVVRFIYTCDVFWRQ